MADDVIGGPTLATLFGYFIILSSYLCVAFTARGSRIYVGPARFWIASSSNGSGAAPGHLRWAQVTLRTAPFNGIQSLRCILQAGIYYGASCIAVSLLVMFFDTNGARRQLLHLSMSCVSICAAVCFVQHMRFCYHLGFLVMFQQPKSGESAVTARTGLSLPTQEAVPNGNPMGIIEGIAARRKFNRAVAMHVVGDSSAANFTSTALDARENPQNVPSGTSESVAHAEADHISGEMLRHIEAENSLDMHQHTARVAYVTQRHAFNFSLGVRLMLFVIPLALGVFGDIFLLLSTLSLLPVLWYFDGLS